MCGNHADHVTNECVWDLGPMADGSVKNRLVVGTGRSHMNIFYIIGVVVVVLAVLGYLRLG